MAKKKQRPITKKIIIVLKSLAASCKKKNHVLVQQEPVVGYEENKDRSDTCTTLTWVALMVSHAEAALLRRAQGLNL